MKRKVAWLVVTGGMVAVLLLASCAPAAVEEEKVAPPVEKKEVVVPPKEVVVTKEEANLVKWTGKKLDGTVVEKMLEKPRYGGVDITYRDSQPAVFDDALLHHPGAWAIDPTNEELITKDWTRGPGGTDEWSAQINNLANPFTNAAGTLAESWELPDPQTVVFHIRQGVRWQNKPPLNGRELTADDVVFSIRREWTIGYHSKTVPFLADMKNPANSIYVSPTDKWAVVIKSTPEMAWVVAERPDFQNIIPRDVVEKYGNMNDWRNVVGTGPFILQDYVGASSLTYVRNPDYWQHDPFFPENQLPYLDSLKVLIIPDWSTRMAALRTGQIDNLYGLTTEDAESLIKTNPKLEWLQYILGRSEQTIHMRNDTKPFDDIRVRRALTMAINRRELTDAYYGGKAVLFNWPTPPIADFRDLYIPLEELPESVRELYEYQPDKARQLLTEAGYPQGFKTEIVVWKPEDIELLQIIKEYWAKIGVDLKIDVKDPGGFAFIESRKTHTQMIMYYLAQAATQAGQSGYLNAERPGSYNKSFITDPWVMEQYNAVAKAITTAITAGTDPKLARQLNNRETIIYRSEQAWFIPLPEPYYYVFWQPWLKGYYGALYTGFHNTLGYADYAWIDQDLKKAMGR